MKSINTLAAVAILALSSAGLASAQTYHLTGSTAYRNAVIAAEVNLCGGTTSLSTSQANAIYWGSTLAGSNYSIIASKSGSLIFENFWNGSIAGDIALTTPLASTGSLTFPQYAAYSSSMTTATSATVSTLTNAGNGQAEAAPTVWPTGITTDVHTVDIAMSDVFFSTAQQIMGGATPPINVTAPAGVTVGVVPFVFVANGSSDIRGELGTPGTTPATVALSMDPQKFTYTWSSAGQANLALFTATPADTAISVFPMGRDVDSGTRSTALAETGYGLRGSGIVTTPVVQFYPYVSNTAYTNDESTADGDPTGVAGFSATSGVAGDDSLATTIEELDPVPFESVDGYHMGDNTGQNDGDGGFFSGGNLAHAISTPFATTGFNVSDTVMVAYLGASDATTALNGTNPAILMAYNGAVWYPANAFPSGVTAASNANQIYYGKYTFWGFEHEYSTTAAHSEAVAVQGQLSSSQLDELSSNSVTVANLKVQRSGDGQNVQ